MGTYHRPVKKDPGCSPATREHSTHARRPVHTHDGSGSDNQCQTSCPSLHHPRVTLHIVSGTDTYPEGWGYPTTWRQTRISSADSGDTVSASPR